MAAKKKSATKKKATPKRRVRSTSSVPVRGGAHAFGAGVGPDVKKLLQPATQASIAKEARSLGNRFVRVRASRGDLVADAREGLGAKADLEDLKKRKFPVNAHTLTRLAILVELLAPTVVDADLARAAVKENTAVNEARRVRLLAIRRQLARLAAAAGLPADWFKLSLRKVDRLNPVVQRLTEIVALAHRKKSELPDPAQVTALLTEAEQLIAAHTETAVDRTDVSGSGKLSALHVEQYTVLLWEVLRHISAVGLAAYPDDPSREARYRLNHVYDGPGAAAAGDEDGDLDDGDTDPTVTPNGG